MARTTIKGLSDLAKIDGGLLDAQFKMELHKVIDDLRDRAALKKPREILIKVSLEPEGDAHGSLLEIKTDIEISSKVPKVKTREYSMGAIKNDALVYNDLAPEDHKQGTLDDLPKESAE